MRPTISRRPASGAPGVALVVTLMMMSVLTMMVVGLAGVMRNEQAASRNFTYQVLADQLAEIGANQGAVAVLANSPRYTNTGTPTNRTLSASGPGWIYAGGTNLLPLFQTNLGQGLANLEEIGTNSLVLGLPDGVAGGRPLWRGLIQAGWSNVLEPGSANTNAVIGRVSWWVDDEGIKLNLNAAGGTNLNGTPLASATPLSTAFVFLNPLTGSTNQFSTNLQRLALRSNWLFTTESLKDTNATGLTNNNSNSVSPAIYRAVKGHVTAWSSNLDLTPWGTAKLDLTQPANQNFETILGVLRTNDWGFIFGTNMTLARKYGGGSLNSTNLPSRRGPAGAGDLALQQIAANLLAIASTNSRMVVFTNFFTSATDLATNRHRYLLPSGVATMTRSAMLEEVRVRVDATATNTTNIALRLAVRVQILNMDNVAKTNLRIDFQPRKFRFGASLVANELPATSISTNDVVNIRSTPLPVSDYQVDCSNSPTTGPILWIGPEWYPGRLRPFPLTSRTETNLGISLPPRSRFLFASLTNTITFNFNRNIGLLTNPSPQCYVILDQILLREGTNIVDWISMDDFAQEGNEPFYKGPANPDNGQMDFSGGNAPLLTFTGLPTITTNDSDWTGPNVFRIRKIDPQVRRSLSYWNTNGNSVGVPLDLPPNARTWTAGDVSLTNTNGSVTGIAYLWPDPAPGVTDVTNHPHFVEGYRPTNGLSSIAQLGAIHTGIPWRTLRLQPQPQVERQAANGATNSPPDWIVLELFSLTNQNGGPATLPMINLNSIGLNVRSAGTGTNFTVGELQMSNASTRSLTNVQRGWAILGAAGILRTNLSLSSSNLVRFGLPISLTNAVYAGLSNGVLASNLLVALSQPTAGNSWAPNSGWGNFRGSASGRLPTNGFVFRGELLEVAGFASDTNNALVGEDILEGRLRTYLDLITTRSDTFSIWSAGQALRVTTNNNGFSTNVMGEVRRQTVFQRIPMTAGNGFVTNYQYRLIYTRNHVVE